VLLVLTDDQGWDDLGFHGNARVRTPNLDAFARSSVRFENFYVAAVCAPTRASLLTGRHFLRTGVHHVHGGKDFVHPDEVMIGELFQRAGYATGMWGKWHSGKTTGYFPWERGFDEAYMARLYKHRDSVGHLNGRYVEHTGWAVDTLTDYCIDFMTRHRDEPFLALLPHMTVHAPLEAPEDLVAHHRQAGLSQGLATMYAMIDQLDASFGRLLEAVERLGLAEDTVVVFLSDNGPAILTELLSDDDRRIRYVNGYKGHKGNMWENGIKSPLWVRWANRLEPRSVGRLADVCDLMPTLLELCGIDLPADHPPLDGRSVVPYLHGSEGALGPKESFVYVDPGWQPDPVVPYDSRGRFDEYAPMPPERTSALDAMTRAICLRTEDYKLLRHPGPVDGAPDALDGSVLVHIAEDPKEDRNVAGDEVELAREMTDRLARWFRGIQDEPHAFHAPVFRIGAGATNVVAAYAPARVFGQVHNCGLHSTGWAATGDAAEFDVQVDAPGRYAVDLALEMVAGASITLRLSVKGSTTTARLDGGGQGCRAGRGADLGELDLPAGRATLRMEATDARVPSGAREAVSRMTMLTFRRVE
jgi:arylsulfatase A-like enzyme